MEARDEIGALRRRYEAGEAVPAAELSSALRRAREAAPGLSAEDARTVHQDVLVLIALVRAQRDRVAERLSVLGKGREAMQGYAAEHAQTAGRRLFRRA